MVVDFGRYASPPPPKSEEVLEVGEVLSKNIF